ncbi:Hypothetical predicted protein [Olea europaea subsp. europaea]|uniref:Uncharacterized protein n=1 Tax=Olea europaea subsp. europaea TaxID=158383 RepID=A0A8S0UJD4_OLEEU|nr:Hypothetical predicted protein [Olea europaea subsp. europaea]
MDNYGQQWDSFPEHLHGTSGDAHPMYFTASDPQEPQPTMRTSAKWNSLELRVFIASCETVITEGHRFNKSAGKSWTTLQMKN